MIKALGSEHPFRHYDLKLSAKEQQHLAQLNIVESRNYDNFGELQDLNSQSTKFLQKIAAGATNEIAALVCKLVGNVLEDYQQETAWITLRSCTPTPLYKTPRWHTDGYYYSPKVGNQYKVVMTLKGKPTLFTNAPPTMKDQFYMLQENNASNEINSLLAHCLIESADSGQGTHFIVGSKDAAIHSEPDITEPRLFLGILPGTKEQIAQWQQITNDHRQL